MLGKTSSGSPSQRGQDAQKLDLRGGIGSAPGFDLDRGGAEASHGGQVLANLDAQAAGRKAMDDAQGALAAVLRFGQRKGQVGVAVDESRHDHFADRVDLDRAPGGGQVFDPAGGSDLLEDSALDQNRAIGNNLEFVEFGAATGTGAAAQS